MRKSEATKARIRWRNEVRKMATAKDYPRWFFSVAIRHDLGHNQGKGRRKPINDLVNMKIAQYQLGGVPIKLLKA